MSEHQHDPGVEAEENNGHAQESDGVLEVSAPAEADGAMMHVDRYEGIWMRISAIVLAIFLVAIVVSAFAWGIQLPGVYARVDPNALYEPGSPFAEPTVRELAPGKYEAYVRSQIWQFTPREIRVPAGSSVTFYVTSQDVQHGFNIERTNINMMVLPGQISTLTATFDEAGTYNIICHEYCGQLHHTMYGQIIVEGSADEAEEEVAQSSE